MKKTPVNTLRILLIVGLIHLLCASLSMAAKSPLPLLVSWRGGLVGVNSENPQNTSRYMEFGLDVLMNYQWTPALAFQLDPYVRFQNGSYESIDGLRDKDNGLFVREASAQWTFTEKSTFSVGALNQTSSHSEILLGSQTFPGARVRWQFFSSNSFMASIEGKQSLPTSSSMSAQTKGSEVTPGLSSASLSFNYETASKYFWKNRVGAFRFENLPGSIAYTSSLLGNTIRAQNPNDASFVYDYQGLELSSELRVPLLRGWDVFARLSGVQNDRAPDNLNRGYMGTLGSEFFIIGQKSIELAASSFHIEPDAAVASFNSAKYFHTNRVGYSVESFLNFKKYNLRLGASYTEAELIYTNPVQNREKNLMITMETGYASI